MFFYHKHHEIIYIYYYHYIHYKFDKDIMVNSNHIQLFFSKLSFSTFPTITEFGIPELGIGHKLHSLSGLHNGLVLL